jgi:hypothetical protein
MKVKNATANPVTKNGDERRYDGEVRRGRRAARGPGSVPLETLDDDGGEQQADLSQQVVTTTISAPRIGELPVHIIGTAPYVQNRFGAKAMNVMRDKQAAGSTTNKGKKRDAKDFMACYEDAKHVSHEGWLGIPAPAFRNAMVDACRLVGFKMTHAKLGVFIQADGFDAVDGTALVKITKGEPKYAEHAVRNESGVADIRPRPMWDPGWEAIVRVKFDADMFTANDVANLMHRVGLQVGVGEGRPNSKKSCGLGWGLFEIAQD